MTAPAMPSVLRHEEKAAWKKLVAEVGGAEVLAPADGPLMRSLAVLIARGENLRKELEGADLLTATARGVTGNPLLGHERETIKEIRLLHERLMKAIAGRGVGAEGAPKSLSEVRHQLHGGRGRLKAVSGGG